MEQNSSNLFELQLDQSSTSYLGQIARWAKFLSIVGFIMCFLVVLGGIFAGTIMAAAFDQLGTGFGTGAGIGAIIFYLLVGLIMFFPALYLYRFSVQMQAGLRTNDQGRVTTAFSNLKSYFKFLGIITIIVLTFYALILIFGVLAGTMAAFS
jgi:uncharacterized membrane protein YuzA (DUF378 family)